MNEQEGINQTYFLPNGFEGCVVINYNVKGAPPLKIENLSYFRNIKHNSRINLPY
ncbi:DUF6843 domain-containing protein [Bacillus andreraoultii]|uniref:DUF6843 domain-containing protein n=1 Tax=Bacillus andreraoultii TaxID=1499685 RepID=UPI000A515E12|nr:hypothetical protein [Bacillus andreraoultii]